MNVDPSLVDRIRAEAQARGETLRHAVRHHLLGGLIARVSRAQEGEGFVLRGGMLTRAWVAPLSRPTTDLDYVGDFPFDVDAVARRFEAILEERIDDGVCIEPSSLTTKGIWLETEFPGARLSLRLGLGAPDQTFTIDVGFNDPLVPAATFIELSGTRVRCVRPETQVAWKLHALAEMGASFRPKDLADLWRITTRVTLDEPSLPPAIDAAFTSRGYPRTDAIELFSRPWWETKTARVRWTPDRTGAGLPALPRVLADVRERLGPALATLAELNGSA